MASYQKCNLMIDVKKKSEGERIRSIDMSYKPFYKRNGLQDDLGP